MTEAALPTGATIGILGGGQLGRMLSLAAARLGFRCHVYDPSPGGPASLVSAQETAASWSDTEALRRFAGSCDVVTYEFENVPTEALDLIEALVPIRPGRRALAISQDRLTEKEFLAATGLLTAPWAPVSTPDDLTAALAVTGTPAIMKTRRFGYDGKGQVRISATDAAENALAALNGEAAIVEGVVDFTCEISVIAARATDGSIACFDPGENVHSDGILRTTTVPAQVTADMAEKGKALATRILEALDYIGVLGVELFVRGENLVVNEFAPRVHNSGHWTQNGCAICQFEQHIRAVAGWPLGDPSRHSNIEMENLIGEDVVRVPALADKAVALHLYGKAEVRPGRKMGHVNRITGPAG